MKGRYLFIIALLGLAATGAQMVSHQHHASSLQAAATAADTAGQDPSAPLATAASYIHGHMGTSLTIFLQGSYDRSVAAAQAAASPQSSGAVYAAAQTACASHADSIVQARCVQSYLAAHATAAPNPQAVAMPVKASYTKAYSAPTFTADGAGITFLVALISLVAGTYMVVLRRL